MKPDIRTTAMAALRYEPESGFFFRRQRCSSKTPDDLRAGTLLQGYVMISVGGRDGRMFRAHRLAWLFMTGDFPPKGKEIDHINGDRADNRWANLRLVTRGQNNMNRGTSRNNKSGQTGVSYQPRRANWTARITIEGKVVCLGDFQNKADAINARLAAEAKHFGRFAPPQARMAVPKGTGPVGPISQLEI